jgi:hypothetical protein
VIFIAIVSTPIFGLWLLPEVGYPIAPHTGMDKTNMIFRVVSRSRFVHHGRFQGF